MPNRSVDATPYLLDPELLPPTLGEPRRLDWSRAFGNHHRVEVEVGFGKGLFLITAAQMRPEINFFGIEISGKMLRYTAERVAKRALSNVRLIKFDARYFFARYVADASLAAVHAYFPDPWWKKRHKKRRLFTPEFAREVERTLSPGGYLHVWSDVEEYFETIRGLVAGETKLVWLPPPDERHPEHDMDYLSNFERKMRKAGRSIYRLRYQKAG